MGKVLRFERRQVAVCQAIPTPTLDLRETYDERQARMARERKQANINVLRSYRIKR